MPPDLQDLIDEYLGAATGEDIAEDRLLELDERLRAAEEARLHFIRYAQLHTDLHLLARSRRAGEKALRRIEALTGGSKEPCPARGPGRSFPRHSPRALRLLAGVAAVALLAAGLSLFLGHGDRPAALPAAGSGAFAWLLNAQDCRWAESMAPAGDMGPGKVLRVEAGLAEVGFESGARIVLEGPASLELISPASARLLRGRATARVPESARGFTILSPRGRVVDLGTEFGLSVADDGSTEVLVFEGRVEAQASGIGEEASRVVTLGERQAAVLDDVGISVKQGPGRASDSRFVREIVPPLKIVPRALRLDFRRDVAGSLRDGNGAGTGLTHRLPGTGTAVGDRDSRLRLDREGGELELTTTNSDINTQFRLHEGEYLGLRLSDLGFHGREDFAVTVSIPDIPQLELVGQFGLYAGARSDKVIRGGLIATDSIAPASYSLFLVNNDGGRDSDLYTVGLLSTGDDLRLTLRRAGGKYSLSVENQTTGSSSTLAIRHPEFLDGENDLHVGVFGANTQSEVSKTLLIRGLEVTVWMAEES